MNLGLCRSTVSSARWHAGIEYDREAYLPVEALSYCCLRIIPHSDHTLKLTCHGVNYSLGLCIRKHVATVIVVCWMLSGYLGMAYR